MTVSRDADDVLNGALLRVQCGGSARRTVGVLTGRSPKREPFQLTRTFGIYKRRFPARASGLLGEWSISGDSKNAAVPRGSAVEYGIKPRTLRYFVEKSKRTFVFFFTKILTFERNVIPKSHFCNTRAPAFCDIISFS